MPITHIHSITQTINLAMEYCSKDKVESATKEIKDDIKDVINYAKNDKMGEVVYHTLTTSINCPSGTDGIYKDFKELIDLHNRGNNSKRKMGEDDNRKCPLAYHLVQSFDGFVPPQIANEIGRKTAEELWGKNGFRVQISTHTNTENTHNHILVCAWNVSGKKHRQTNDFYNHIREVSDRISEEYGLAILENTRKQKLVRWQDENGITHYYEPTKRKNDLYLHGKDLNYKGDAEKGKSIRWQVKKDIDLLLPVAMNYEHLLALLRERFGYKISDKTKSGEWREHISFKPPMAEKAVRDYTLDKSGYYTRENLTEIISKNGIENVEKGISHGENDWADYDYLKLDVSMLDERYRGVKGSDYNELKIERGKPEKNVVKEIKTLDEQLHLALSNAGYNSNELDDIIKRNNAKSGKSKKQLKVEQQREVNATVNYIQDYLNALHFLEKKDLLTYSQINDTVKNLWQSYNDCYAKLNGARMDIERLNKLLLLPKKHKEVSNRIERMAGQSDYMQHEYLADVSLLKKYEELMKKYNLSDGAMIEKLRGNIDEFNSTCDRLMMAMEQYKNSLKQYDYCVELLRQSDGRGTHEFDDVWREYDRINKDGKDDEKSNEKKKRARERTAFE